MTPKQNLNFHQDDWAAFFKDDWNVTSNLTLNWGIRWDVYGVPYEGKGLAPVATDGNFLGISGPSGQLTSVTQVGKNSLNPGLSVYDKDWNNIAPSFGFSYRVPWLDRTTVVRAGYGISYSGAPDISCSMTSASAARLASRSPQAIRRPSLRRCRASRIRPRPKWRSRSTTRSSRSARFR